VDIQPKPYVPLSVHAHEFRQPVGQQVRPWMLRRNGETVAAWRDRTNHSCYRCGVYIADMRKLDTHEADCHASAGDVEGSGESQ
jgi:hypothetical protein